MEENTIEELLDRAVKAINAYGKSNSYAMLCIASQALDKAMDIAYKH